MTITTLRELDGTALRLSPGIRRAAQFEGHAFILKPGDVVNKKRPARPHPMAPSDGPTARLGDLAINIDYKPGCAMVIDEGLVGVQPTKGIVLASISSTPQLDAGYLRGWILAGELERQLLPRHRGSTMSYVKLEDLLETAIPIPSLSLQRELAERFVAAENEFLIATRYAEEAREMLELESMYLVVKATDAAQSAGH